MEVIVAKSAGFCFGVERAVNTVYQQIKKDNIIFTFGPIIHNEIVVNDLKKKHVEVIHSIEELNHKTEGIVVIRSHGVSREIYQQILDSKLQCIDATCPFVKRIHKIVDEKSLQGIKIVVIGDKNHPEVQGIVGWSNSRTEVIESEEEIDLLDFKKDEKLCIVAQTTFNMNKFEELVEIFQKKGYDISVANTICSATSERQNEARDIASKVDAMIVIGSTQSSNSKKLFEICSIECKHTYFIQTLDDLQLDLPNSVSLVGITAGASTPSNIIEEVQNYVRVNF